jgi:hypothetical protein
VRIALISDSHIRNGVPVLSEKLIQLLQSADLILHAGDISDSSGLETFQALGPKVVAVCGNTDERRLVQKLPTLQHVETPAGTIALMHVLPHGRGGPAALIQQFLGNSSRPLAVVHGHTHYPEVTEVNLSDGRAGWIINPGSLTRSRGGGHTCAMMETDSGGGRVWIEKLA